MASLPSFSRLRSLTIASNRDHGCRLLRIKGMHDLERLMVSSQQITDSGLAALEGMTRLTETRHRCAVRSPMRGLPTAGE